MQQQVFQDLDQLAAALREYCAKRRPCLVVIDGFTNSGKSKLARRLSPALGAVHVKLDDFLKKHQLHYVAHIRYSELRETLSEKMSKSQCVILEGVCAQEVLKRIEVTSTASVYVKRLVGQWWFDGRILSEAWGLKQAMALEEGKTQLTSQLSIEVFTYHFQFRPHERSTFVYTWDDTD